LIRGRSSPSLWTKARAQKRTTMCKRAAAAKPTKPDKPAAAVSNPLKDKERIRAAAIAAARELVAEEARFTGAQFSRKVLEKMGCGREFAVNDQGTRTRLHSKDVKLAAFEAVGVGGAWLKAHEVKPGPAVPVALPELPPPGDGTPPSPLSEEEHSAMRARLGEADAAELERRGALLIPGLLTPMQAPRP
jgi:hypothetical protein